MAEQEFRKKDNFWTKWGAVVVLGVFFLASWGGQFAMQLRSEQLIAEQHGQEFVMDDFWPEFFSSTFENWQSEWLQLFVQALLLAGFTSYVFRKQNEEHYKTQIMLDDLRKEIKAIKR
jgi:hypothetical protein